MNILSVKCLAWSQERQVFHSPQKAEFEWKPGIISRACSKCPTDQINLDCTCGIYASPNPEALYEYAVWPNTLFVLMNTYGWVDIWSGPKDLYWTNVTRSWGTQIVGLISMNPVKVSHGNFEMKPLNPAKQQSMLWAADYYQVNIFPWAVARSMIHTTWERAQYDQIGQGLPWVDPFEDSKCL